MKKIHSYIKRMAVSCMAAISCLSFFSCSSEEETINNLKTEMDLTVTASYGEVLTRTNVSEGGTCTWSADDKLLVTDATGTKKGILALHTGAGDKTAKFTGTIASVADGTNLNFIYLGTSVDLTTLDNSATTATIDLSVQDGTIANLNKGDIMSASSSVTVTNGTAFVSALTLEKKLAIAHFSLQLPDGVSLNSGTLTLDGVYPQAVINLTNGEIIESQVKGTINFTSQQSSNIYVNLVPGSVTPTFKYTINDLIYQGTLSEKTIQAGDFLCETNGNGISIKMNPPVSPVDHSKNPLAKWAETNLVRKSSTSGASVENEFAASIYDRGSYYQFGRNHGFNTYTEAINSPYVACKKNVPSNSTVYDGSGTGTPVYAVYNSTTNVANHPEKYFLHDEYDWWPYDSGKNQTWEERATFSGYNIANPCPEGWRLPTKADFTKIMPTTAITDWETMTNGSAELKTLEDGTQYAVRWQIISENSMYLLEIKAIVVDTDFEESSLNLLDWNDDHVVVRKFPGTGYIYSYYAVYSNHYYARPLPFGSFSEGIANNSVKIYNITDEGYLTGNYWASDSDQSFMSFNCSSGKTWIKRYIGFNECNALPIRCIKIN